MHEASDDASDPRAPSLEDLDRIAAEALGALPEPVRAACAEVAIRIADFADDATLDAMGIEDPFDLTGLYQGIPLTEKSVMDQPEAPDTVWLYRRPILEEWVARGDVGLRALVGHVLVHELAHHLGWSDEDIAAIDPWWE